MANTQYKCPACGGALAFDSAAQKLKCPYCGSEYEIPEQPDPAQEQAEPDIAGKGPGSMEWDVRPGGEWDAGEQESMNVYVCESCGGESIIDANTASTRCPYCDSNIVLKGKLSGVLKPDYVIPFRLDKKAAKEKLREHVNSKKLVPKLFKDENHIDEIKGVYIPFWLFDAEVDADIAYTGEKVRSWSDSEYDYVETETYRIYRSGKVAFDHVPVDGSEKMPDDLMESIEPFDFSGAMEFRNEYLAGFLADKYDVDAESSIAAANERIKKSTIDAFDATVIGYSSVMPTGTHINLKNGVAKYALYPVWLLNTKWRDQTYTFAMNGQTGKFVGDLPLDKGAFWRKFGLLGGLVGAAASALAIALDFLFI